MADWWQHLPKELLPLIGNKLDVVADRCRFRSVCKSWRCSLPPFAQPPWLMLSEPASPQSPPRRGFVGIGGNGGEPEQQQQMVYEIELPEAHERRCVGSTGNWLITVDISGMIHLLNPISRVQIDLPSQSTLRKTIMSCCPSLSTTDSSSSCSKDCIVMAIYHYHQQLAFARPGDASWTTVHTPEDEIDDIIFFKNKFYAVNRFGVLMVCDIDDDGLDSPKATVVAMLPKSSYRDRRYLVECSGELLVLVRSVNNFNGTKKTPPPYTTRKFDVYKLVDFTNSKWEEVDSLGEYCLFLGLNTSVSFPAVNYSGSLKKNCIYFTDDIALRYGGVRSIPGGGSDMGVFDMEDKTIQPHYKGEFTCYYSPPLWLIPTLPMK